MIRDLPTLYVGVLVSFDQLLVGSSWSVWRTIFCSPGKALEGLHKSKRALQVEVAGDILLDGDDLDLLASGLTVAERPDDPRIASRRSLMTWILWRSWVGVLWGAFMVGQR